MLGEKQEVPWPLPKFSFNVSFGDKEMVFQEVSGLDTENDIVEYRGGNSNPIAVNMPGLRKTSNVTLRRGVADKDLFNY